MIRKDFQSIKNQFSQLLAQYHIRSGDPCRRFLRSLVISLWYLGWLFLCYTKGGKVHWARTKYIKQFITYSQMRIFLQEDVNSASSLRRSISRILLMSRPHLEQQALYRCNVSQSTGCIYDEYVFIWTNRDHLLHPSWSTSYT